MGEVLFNTNEVAKMLRVDKSTVKRWTDEGKLKCFRTPGGHRKFRADDVYNFMSQFNYGVSTLQIMPELASDEAIIKRIVQKKEFNVLTSVCFNAAIKGKKDEVLALFIEIYRAGLSPAEIFDFILTPSLKKVSDTFRVNKISFTEFQLAHNALSSAIIQFTDSISRVSRNNKTIICVSLEQEKHDVEIKALVTLLEVEGFTVLNLGVGVAAEAVNQLIYRTKPFAVCIYSSTAANEENFIVEVEKVLRTAKENMTHVVAGGKAFQAQNVRENFVGVKICAQYSDFVTLQYQEDLSNVNK